MPRRALYLQSGGVTAVLNASAAGVIDACRDAGLPLLAARDGLAGLLRGDIVDTDLVDRGEIARLCSLPGGCFGASRRMLPAFDADPAPWWQLRDVLQAYGVDTVFLNGGNGSMASAAHLAQFGDVVGYPLTVVGVPKTIDNDLPATDTCPGYGSAAKYLATSMLEAILDLRSMAGGKRVFILETMGRHTGWLAAACALAATATTPGPQIVLVPEVPFNPEAFLAAVQTALNRDGYCAVAVAEGLRDQAGNFLAEARAANTYGFEQLGGVGQTLAALLRQRLGVAVHLAVADYLQRAGRHLAAAVDVAQAYAVGAAAVPLALAGQGGCMTTVVRTGEHPYTWSVGQVPLAVVADQERALPAAFLAASGLGVSEACVTALRPLIEGERPPPFVEGVPDYRSVAWPKARPLIPTVNP